MNYLLPILAVLFSFAVLAANPLVIPTPMPLPTCVTPDLLKCQSDGHLRSYCGAVIHRKLCTDLITAEFKRIMGTLPTTSERFGPGSATRVRAEATDFSHFTISGMEGQPSAFSKRNQLLTLKKGRTLNAAELLWLIIRQGWENNGAKVEMCHEFAFEKYYDYAKFEDAIAPLMQDNRAIFTQAFQRAEGGISNRTLHAKDGTGFQIRFPLESQPKNKYHQISFQNANVLWYPQVTDGPLFHFAPELVTVMTNAASRHHQVNWYWHELAARDLAATPDATLASHYKKQLDFERLLEQREAIHVRWEPSFWKLMIKLHEMNANPAYRETALKWHNSAFVSELYLLDQKIQTALLEARNNGCLNPASRTVCDWSPELFVEQLKAAVQEMKKEDFKKCTHYTGNNFTPESRIVRRNGHLSTTAMDAYFRAYQVELDNLPFTANPTTGRPVIGEENSDDASEGNKYFGVGYNYSSSWKAADFLASTERTCDANLSLRTSFTAWVKLFGEQMNVLEARGDIGSRKRAQNQNERELHAGLTVKVLGNDLLSPPIDQTAALEISIQRDNLFLEKEASVAQTIVVIAVPITLRVGMSGKLGVRPGLSANFSRNCATNQLAVTLGGSVEPFLRLDGFASAAVDLALVEIGVRGELNLIDLRLPFTAQTRIVPSAGELLLSSSSRLNLEIRSLSGRILLYIDYTADEAHVTIARWRGSKEVIPLFRNLPIKDVSLGMIKQQ